MTETESERLIARYKNTWRGGPHVDEIRTHFLEMDAGTVGTILVRLARDEEHAPSIARIWREYRGISTTATDPLPCAECDSSGWVSAYTNPEGYRYARPCRSCRHGEAATKLDMAPSGAFFDHRSDNAGVTHDT